MENQAIVVVDETVVRSIREFNCLDCSLGVGIVS
jgi:hypothetical protein